MEQLKRQQEQDTGSSNNAKTTKEKSRIALLLSKAHLQQKDVYPRLGMKQNTFNQIVNEKRSVEIDFINELDKALSPELGRFCTFEVVYGEKMPADMADRNAYFKKNAVVDIFRDAVTALIEQHKIKLDDDVRLSDLTKTFISFLDYNGSQ